MSSSSISDVKRIATPIAGEVPVSTAKTHKLSPHQKVNAMRVAVAVAAILAILAAVGAITTGLMFGVGIPLIVCTAVFGVAALITAISAIAGRHFYKMDLASKMPAVTAEVPTSNTAVVHPENKK